MNEKIQLTSILGDERRLLLRTNEDGQGEGGEGAGGERAEEEGASRGDGDDW
jgi:hypothetical protein